MLNCCCRHFCSNEKLGLRFNLKQQFILSSRHFYEFSHHVLVILHNSLLFFFAIERAILTRFSRENSFKRNQHTNRINHFIASTCKSALPLAKIEDWLSL